MSDAPQGPGRSKDEGEPPEEPTDDEVWQDLVSRLQGDSDQSIFGSEEGRESELPGTEQSEQSEHRSSFRQFDPLNVQAAAEPEQAPAAGPRDYELSDDEEDFVPAEPASLATVEPSIALAWLGAAGMPVALLCAAIFWRDAPLMLIIAAIAAFLLSVGYLIYRLPGHRDHDDDGAQV
ncbi:hypothetical protein [Psychromicrobium lacuslunae]|uniref:Uncharacterized protein n=1 Tax=Psychromicrobium lacuslunae TaxID=1618207 RepID=A0A0D4BX67_9MICC|nr:hypothetical protein [Psychromicrobium lacuslunae]AJT40706.1 hypothetical protein UM93_02765 [Psychromicrobium lacuslunae]